MTERIKIKGFLDSTGIQNTRFDLTNEKRVQQQIYDLLLGKVVVAREVRLDNANIIDFISGSIGIEVKLTGSIKNIYRQCERYCKFQEVAALILITNRIVRLPSAINSKPTHVINLGQSWL